MKTVRFFVNDTLGIKSDDDEDRFSDIKVSSIKILKNLKNELILIDKGAFGIVWKAQGTLKGKTITLALKQQKPNFGSFPLTERSLSINEGKILSDLTLRHLRHIQNGCPKRLRNENCNEGSHYIVRGYPCLLEQKINLVYSPVWIPTKFFEAKNLQNTLREIYFKKSPDFTLQQKLTLVKQVIFGCKAIAKSGDIHGDLKSSNILVRRGIDGKSFKTKVIDLGTSGLRRYQTEKRISKSNYLATSWFRHPKDELLCSPLGVECDLFAIGCLIFNVITLLHLLPYDDYQEDYDSKRYDPYSDQRIVFMALMEKLNGPLKQKWFKTANPHQVTRYYKLENDGTYTFKYKNDFSPIKDLKDKTKEALILQPLLEAANQKDYPHAIMHKLFELISDLISYDPPSYEEVLERIQNIEELLNCINEIEKAPSSHPNNHEFSCT